MADTGASDLSPGIQTLSVSEKSPLSTTTQTISPASEISSKPVFYGALSSQYRSLDQLTVARLEQAILHCRVRAFHEARAIIDSFPDQLRYHPAVAFERSQIDYFDWKLSDCLKFLRGALAWAKANGKDDNASGLYTLLRIALGRAEVFAEGDFTKARDSMREIRRWLMDTPIEQYTDVQVQCIVQYHFLILVARMVTGNFDEDFYLRIPLISKENGGHRLSQLREYLQDQGRLPEAVTILPIEGPFLADGAAIENACRSLLEACSRHSTLPSIWYVEGKARTHLGKTLKEAGGNEEADREFQLAREVLKTRSVSDDLNKSELDIRIAELRSGSDPDPLKAMKDWAALSEQPSVQSDGYVMSTALTKTAELALEVLRKTPNQENRAVYWHWQNKAEALLEELGDLYFLYLGITSTADAASDLFDDYASNLQRHDNFEAKYPKFQLWELTITAKRRDLFTYVRIGDVPNIAKTVHEISEISRVKDAFWAEEGYNVQTRAELAAKLDAEPGGGSSESKVYDAWFSEWVDEVPLRLDQTPGSQIQLGTTEAINPVAILMTLARWLKAAWTKGELSRTELVFILCPDSKDEDGVDVATLLDLLTPEILSASLFGTKTSQTSMSRWEKVSAIMSDWLRHRAKYNETKRHYLLCHLQVDMLNQASSREDHLIQSARLIDLIPTLNQEASQAFSGNIPNWRNIMAGEKKMIEVVRRGAVLSDETEPEFIEILELYKLSLEENRQRGHHLQEAMTALFIAEHYFYAAIKLRPTAVNECFSYLDQAETAYQKNREGWKVLSGWDKVEKLLMAIGTERRLQVSPLAINVLCNFPESHQQERDTGIWTMIQIAKSIGLGWLMRTNSLDDVDKQSKITTGTEFKEIPPITPEDLAHITADAGGDVVYVDWYNASSSALQMAKPLVLILAPGQSPKVMIADITWEKIDSVVKKLLSYDEEDLGHADARKLLRRLNPLVKPLAELTKPGQVLVLSSVGTLHQTPLHALLVDGEVLIRRNPVVYCASMTVLDVIVKNQRKALDSPSGASSPSFHKMKATIFGDPPSSEGREALASLASELSLTPHTPATNTFTTTTFESVIRNPGTSDSDSNNTIDLFHYHGHASFDVSQPLDQGLEFADGRYTLRRVFDLSSPSATGLSAPSGYHATLLGCSSGMSTTTVSSDVVGLVPAFLYAGAASTVSGLWRLDDKDAAIYSAVFYREILGGDAGDGKPTSGETPADLAATDSINLSTAEAVPPGSTKSANTTIVVAAAASDDAPLDGEPHSPAIPPEEPQQNTTPTRDQSPRSAGKRGINLARAHQKAVLAVMDARPALVHWAPFVLNGWWVR